MKRYFTSALLEVISVFLKLSAYRIEVIQYVLEFLYQASLTVGMIKGKQFSERTEPVTFYSMQMLRDLKA